LIVAACMFMAPVWFQLQDNEGTVVTFPVRLVALGLVPLSLALEYFEASPTLVFIGAAAAIIPLADWIRRGTEQLARIAGPAIGGLLNITFGNVAELILALFVLRSGNVTVVKATITGSIVSNSLLGLGLAILVGSWGREKQVFNRGRAGLLASLLILSLIALLLPALFDYTERSLRGAARAGVLDEKLSLGVAAVLIVVYASNLLYTLVTHRNVFGPEEETEHGKDSPGTWSLWQGLAVLAAATVAVAFEAELISGALEATSHTLGLTEFFLGIMVLPLIGNAAEYFAAVYFARQDRMDLVITIAVGSTIQIALFTAPVLVLVSWLIGTPMDLVFSNPLELVAVAGVTFAVNAIAQDGETNWLEGVLLLAVYVLLGLTFFFLR
jgi:Ca2+:H+ antiporter